MKKIIQLFIFICFVSATSHAQEVSDHENYRTYTGEFNNLSHPDWGKTWTNLLRVTRIGYDDGISSPAGQFRPNPRALSNAIFNQDDPIYDPLDLSDFCWVFGQFIDHTIDLTTDNPNEDASIPVPTGDIYFDPQGTGTAKIHMFRNVSDPATGTSTSNPRQHPNVITPFIDASNVYGTTPEWAAWLRTFEGGKLKTSAGNLLPFNTISGEYEDEIDPNAPEMAYLPNISNKYFVAGDIRANENSLLTVVHTLFMREHNRQCDLIAAAHPDWNDEQIYQYARKIVSGELEAITYEEWLPSMGIQLEPYTGYKDDVNPQIMNVFSAAAYRLGHTQLSSEIKRYNAAGQVMPEGNLLLRDAFFNPLEVRNMGLDPYIRGMGVQKEQMLDAKLVHDVRNFLFGEPGQGGLDLASVNIQRGRERGLPDYNAVRVDFGLPHISFFQGINDDPDVFNPLIVAYDGNINIIDPWVGLLSEKALPNSIFGETLTKIMTLQFTALRDGDRFYYENDPILTPEEKDAIKNTRFRDIIMENSGVTIMQENVFTAMPMDEICNALFVSLSGNIHTEAGDNVGDVSVTVLNDDQNYEGSTDEDGNFSFEDVPGCGTEGLQLSKNVNFLNGVTTFDLILIQKHILGIQPFTSPYKILASDVDRSGSISTFDLIRLRQAILGLITEFPNNESWLFVPANFTFEEPLLILNGSWETNDQFNGLLSVDYTEDFIAVKVGDVNNSASTATSGISVERVGTSPLQLNIGNESMEEGQVYQTELSVDFPSEVLGYQFALSYNPELIEIVNVEARNNFSSDYVAVHPSEVLVSWNTATPKRLNNQVVLNVVIKAKADVVLADAIQLNNRIFANQVYDGNLHIGDVNLGFNGAMVQDFYVGQNEPNPFTAETTIHYYLPEDGVVNRVLTDATGREIAAQSQIESAGTQSWQLKKSDLPASGVYFYKITFGDKVISKRFVLQ